MSRVRTPRSERLLHAVPATPTADGPPAEGPVSERPLLRVVVGARLRRARTAQGRSLREVADAAGVSTGHLSQVERGLAEASSEVLRAVCRSLSLPQAMLLRAVSADLALAEPTRVTTAVLASPPATAPGAVQALAA
ncbi:Helix-turn-helix domain-containing protein [Quadrisphaera granulorum]|uniref:Helix-turn-helix protein n=1 Tax=Quadrisphaera granulorum TaxID=317664 RepID=A0A316A6V3_9ACTN|nr:helix-turn-helix domain-containing protein [Quadrisphaera granulorum]PWJ53445.1 helix-turn-helix protein [Quadrisphaera granulorum]SZE96787.1 Helix-turn-helix domain-containing protein [Quadrisphaera granulorum]